MSALGRRQLACLRAAARVGPNWRGVMYGLQPPAWEGWADVPDEHDMTPRRAFLILEDLEDRGLVSRGDEAFVITEAGAAVLADRDL